MRFTDILSESILTELKMSPGFLQKIANSVEGAQAGMEFEMCVPDVNQSDPDDFYPEADYEQDERTHSIENVCQFFFDGDYNGRQDVARLREKLVDEYQEWLTSKIAEDWDEGGGYEACLEYFVDDEGLEGEEAEAAAAEMMSDKSGRAYDGLWDTYFEEHQDDYTDRDWIEDEYDNMSDISNSFDIQWPHYTQYEESNEGIGELADEFGSMIGREVNWSNDYHGATREDGKYCLEPDSSVGSDEEGMAGLEFISPPLPLKDMISDLAKVTKWAKKKGCETNDSTGLHMNVSVPNFNPESLDYIKFAIFLGDEYILRSFGREGNTYAKSAISRIKKRAEILPDKVVKAFDMLRSHLQQIATHAIHDGTTDKYTSINMKKGYAEIRSPGGDWLNEDIEKLTATLNRIVVAFDAACDPTKYAKEYATKFYKLMSPEADDALDLFTLYSNGSLTAEELKDKWANKVLNNPETKKSAKYTVPLANKIINGPAVEQLWYVSPVGQVGKEMQIRANTENEAMLKAIEWRPDIYGNLLPGDIRVAKDSATLHRAQSQQQQTPNWEIYDIATGETKLQFYAASNTAAVEKRITSSIYGGDEYRVRGIVQYGPGAAGAVQQERWGRWFVDFEDHTQAAVSARNREEAENAGYQLGRGRIIGVTPE